MTEHALSMNSMISHLHTDCDAFMCQKSRARCIADYRESAATVDHGCFSPIIRCECPIRLISIWATISRSISAMSFTAALVMTVSIMSEINPKLIILILGARNTPPIYYAGIIISTRSSYEDAMPYPLHIASYHPIPLSSSIYSSIDTPIELHHHILSHHEHYHHTIEMRSAPWAHSFVWGLICWLILGWYIYNIFSFDF